MLHIYIYRERERYAYMNVCMLILISLFAVMKRCRPSRCRLLGRKSSSALLEEMFRHPRASSTLTLPHVSDIRNVPIF